MVTEVAINVWRCSHKVHITLFRFKPMLSSLDRFQSNHRLKILENAFAGAKVLHAAGDGLTDGRTDRWKGELTDWQPEGRTDTTKLVIVFRTFVKTSKENTRIYKKRKLDKSFDNSKTSRIWESNSFSSRTLFIKLLFIYWLIYLFGKLFTQLQVSKIFPQIHTYWR
jgi:hypothetical protein